MTVTCNRISTVNTSDPTQPSIAEMTAKAIELLSQDRDGFFLMVEGSQVDWAGHNNDPIYMTTDFLAFDEAVKVACDFADEKGKTLVMAFPDHNTGGMKIGHYYTAMGYTETTIEDLVDPPLGHDDHLQMDSQPCLKTIPMMLS
jgi:alkaline phosphatase